jgi:predicted metal-dependent phosphoesterase TrpH/aminoglycoside phosphotransferase (APT) family kinase protein
VKIQILNSSISNLQSLFFIFKVETMILELHCHTAEHSDCSHVSAAELVQSNFEQGLNGTVLTDHHYLWPLQEIRGLRNRVKVPDHYLILAGQEVETRELGHVLVFGADRSLEPGSSLVDIRTRFPNAAIVWAHPYRDENIPSGKKLLHPLIDGVEIFNSNHTVMENNRGLIHWHHYKFTALSGTDTHSMSYAALYPTLFDHPLTTIQQLAGEIRAGRCRPFFEEIPRAGTSGTGVTEVTLGTGAGKKPHQYIVRSVRNVSTWRSAARTAEIIQEIGRHGFGEGTYRVPKQLGTDQQSLTVIEQGIPGISLFDAIVRGSREESAHYLNLAAAWLARLHNARLHITPADEFLRDEPSRLEYYLSAFYKTGNRHARRAAEIMDTALDLESKLYCGRTDIMVQAHGDYHPRNIFIARDRDDTPSTTFVAAVDFNNSFTMPPAFDVGTFLSQFRNQFYGDKEVLSKVSEELFLKTYLELAEDLDSDFLFQVELFRARTALSICYHLIKVGLGESENLWRVLLEAGRILTHLEVGRTGTPRLIERPDKKQRSA